MKKVKFQLFVFAGLLTLMVSSCRKNSAHPIDDSRVYTTRYDSTINFANYTSFRVADSVTVIRDGQFMKHAYTAYDSTLIAALDAELISRGYQLQTDSTKTPDLGVNVTRIITDYSGVVTYDNYWGGYGSYWNPYYWGYGGYGYYYPYSFDTYTFREGAVSIDMLDLKNPNTTNNKLNTMWTGLGRGVGIFDVANVTEEIQALFNQSAYLQR